MITRKESTFLGSTKNLQCKCHWQNCAFGAKLLLKTVEQWKKVPQFAITYTLQQTQIDENFVVVLK